jgi:hypothetical protein
VKRRAQLVVERVDADALLHCLDYQFWVAAAAGKVKLRLLPHERWLLTHAVGVVLITVGNLLTRSLIE